MNPKIRPAPLAAIGQANELVQFGGDRIATGTLLANPQVRMLLVALELGQEIPLHAPGVDLLVVVADGVGEILAADRLLRPGEVAVVPAGQTRGIRARSTRLVIITVPTPPAEETDQAPADGARWPQEREPEPEPAALIRAEHAELRTHHDHLRALADELGVSDERQLHERIKGVVAWLRRSLVGLEAVLRGHFDKEERVYLPPLEHLTPDASEALATQLERAPVIGHER